jgi:hypothetical protein
MSRPRPQQVVFGDPLDVPKRKLQRRLRDRGGRDADERLDAGLKARGIDLLRLCGNQGAMLCADTGCDPELMDFNNSRS